MEEAAKVPVFHLWDNFIPKNADNVADSLKKKSLIEPQNSFSQDILVSYAENLLIK